MQITSWKNAKAAGKKHYFTGKMCKRGHICKRTVSNRNCIECNRQKNRKYWKNNPEIRKTNKQNRRAQKLAVGGRHTKNEILKLLKNQNNSCACCNTNIRRNYHVDHIIPLSDTIRSSNAAWNLQLLCPSCNLSKGAKDPSVWASENNVILSVDVLSALA